MQSFRNDLSAAVGETADLSRVMSEGETSLRHGIDALRKTGSEAAIELKSASTGFVATAGCLSQAASNAGTEIVAP